MINEIYTDGASRGNPGFASYAVIIRNDDGTITKRGEVFEFKTNNQMEILAGCKALQYITKERESGILPKDKLVCIYSDSALLCNMFNKRWINKWESDGSINWRPNNDLLKLILNQSRLAGEFKFVWVKGHSSNEFNQMADNYCNELMDNYGKS